MAKRRVRELEQREQDHAAARVDRNILLQEPQPGIDQTEQALRESEERFRLATEATSDVIYDWNLETNTIWRSQGYMRFMLLPSPQEQRPSWWQDRIHPEDREKVLGSLQAALAGQAQVWIGEYRFCRDDGVEIFLTERARIIYDEAGAPTRIVGAISDVTGRKRAEEQLQNYTERLGILRDIDRAILAAQSPEAIAQIAVSHMRKLITCQRASVTELKIEIQEAILLAVDTDGETHARVGDHLPFAERMVSPGHANLNLLQPGQVWEVEDLRVLSNRSPLLVRLQNEGILSYMSVPLFVQERLLGLLNIGRNTPGRFSAEHKEIALEVASSLAVAIYQARLYEQVAQQTVILEQLVVQRTAELQERQRFSEQVVETSPEIIYVYDLIKHSVVYLNRQVATLLGYSAEKAAQGTSQELRTFFHPGDFSGILDRIRQFATAQDDDILAVEYRMRHRNGEWRWLLDRGRVFARNADGVPTLSLGMIQDVTERKRTEEALRAAEEEYRAIFEHASIGIYRSSLDGHQLRANPALVKLNGYTSEEEMLPAVNDIASEWYVDSQRRAEFARILAEQERVINFESEVYRHKTRERIWISETARLVRDRTGAPLYYEGTVQDITEKIRLQEQLIGQERWAALGRVTGAIAHELGTPLNSVLGYTQLLAQELLPEKARRRLGIIEAQVQRMAEIIQHYLSNTRAPQQNLQQVELNMVVRETLEQLAPQLQRQRVEVDTLLADIPLLPRANRASLQRVLINILNNAVDALTETRRISIATRYGISPENGSSEVVLEVKDTGVGIPPEHLPKVFQLFFSVKNSQLGTGLGLAICQEIVKAHRGTMTLTSQVGQGTTVLISLPCE